MSVTFNDPTGEITRIADLQTVTAGVTQTYNFWNGIGFDPGGIQGHNWAPIPIRYFMVESDTITTSIVNLQVGDTITNVRLRVLEWLHLYV